MANLFSKPNIPTPQAPATPPTIDQAAQATDYADRLRKRRGAASTILNLGGNNSLGAAPMMGAATSILGT